MTCLHLLRTGQLSQHEMTAMYANLKHYWPCSI